MKILTLIENTSGNPACACEHGLSVYIETIKHKILLDTGASDAFLQNARKLNVDLTKVDILVLSHGHYDHAGGIMAFSEINPRARIYMKETAACDYYHGQRYIGIDKRISKLPQVHLVDQDEKIDDELSVFSHVTGRRFFAQSNLSLTKRIAGTDVQDFFDHEQYLVITQNQTRILLSGCAHNGILNILDQYQTLYGGLPQIVISGFHMMKKTAYTEEEVTVIRKTADELSAMPTVFYTGHCTGEAAYAIMKSIMGNKLLPLHSGTPVVLPPLPLEL